MVGFWLLHIIRKFGEGGRRELRAFLFRYYSEAKCPLRKRGKLGEAGVRMPLVQRRAEAQAEAGPTPPLLRKGGVGRQSRTGGIAPNVTCMTESQ